MAFPMEVALALAGFHTGAGTAVAALPAAGVGVWAAVSAPLVVPLAFLYGLQGDQGQSQAKLEEKQANQAAVQNAAEENKEEVQVPQLGSTQGVRKLDLDNSEALGGYQIVAEIGQGAFATVFSAVRKQTNEKVAIKVFADKSASFRDEIIGFHAALEDSKFLYLLTDLAEQSLKHFLNKIKTHCVKERLAQIMFFQACCGLNYLHDYRVAHRDVKLENLVMSQGKVMLIDFGLSTVVPEGHKLKGGLVGSAAYLSPEIVGLQDHTVTLGLEQEFTTLVAEETADTAAPVGTQTPAAGQAWRSPWSPWMFSFGLGLN
ncbi:unnamed protein product [Effrenium voratum]|nr:unnamed protein product [Effrenium voratum]